MNFRKLAVPLLLLALAPLAHAQVPEDVTLAAGAVKGLVNEDSQDVVPYKGNATVAFTARVGCVAVLDAMAAGAAAVDHLEVSAKDPPAWLLAEHEHFDLDPTECIVGAAANQGYILVEGAYPFSVAAGAPGIVTQTLNLTAGLENGKESNVVPVLFAVQFHSDYDVVPSLQFPHTVTGGTANFTVTVTNRANTRGMVMVEEMHVSTGTFGGLSSTVYEPPETRVFQVQFKAPDRCWTEATVDFKTFSHYLLLDQRAGTYKDGREYAFTFRNGDACDPADDKESPLGGWVLISAILGAALVARRRLL